MRGKMVLVSAVVALAGVVMAEERLAKYEEELRADPRLARISDIQEIIPREMVRGVSRDPAHLPPPVERDEIIRAPREEGERGIILAEGFETAWPPAGWTVIQTNTDVSGPAPGFWTQQATVAGISPRSGTYMAGLWWSLSHQDEWLITPDFTLTGSVGGVYYLSFWTYGFEGSIHADNYYLKVSTDGGVSWTVLLNLSTLTGGWNYWNWPYVIDLSPYADSTIRLAWHAEDRPANDGLWYVWFLDDIEVGYPLAHDVGVTAIRAPVGIYLPNVSITPRVEVGNFGANDEIFDVTFKIFDAGMSDVYSVTVSETLMVGTADTVQFPPFMTVLGEYTTLAYTGLAGDLEPGNDSLSGTFYVSEVIPEDTIHFDGENFDAIGLTAGGTFEGAIRITPAELVGYGGWQIASVIFYHHETGTHSGKVKIYGAGTPTSPGLLVREEPFTVTGSGWKRIDLPDPLLLDTGSDVWVAVEITHAAGAFPLGVDAGPMVSGKGGWIYLAPGPWRELTEFGLNYNWNIRAIVEMGVVHAVDIEVDKILLPVMVDCDEVIPQVVLINRGEAEETFPVSLEIFENGISVYYNVQNPTLGVDVTDTVSFAPWSAISGLYTAVAIASAPLDGNPANDTLGTAFTVYTWLEDFEVTDGRFSANAGWEWGDPDYADGPPAAKSGVHLWGTNLTGDYSNNADYRLERDFYALSDSPVLSFYHWYDIETRWDGGNVKISTDEGASWTVISPTGGYDALPLPANPLHPDSIFTGVHNYWESVYFDLSGYVSEGDLFHIRWHFGSDAIIRFAGWYIDDVAGLGLTGRMAYETWVSRIITDPVPAMIEAGSAVHIGCIIRNTPVGPPAHFRVFLKIGDQLGRVIYSSFVDVRDLPADARDTVWFSPDWVPSTGEYTLTATIQNAFEPSDLLGDNVMTLDIVVGGSRMAVEEVPDIFFLSQNRPNPVTGRTVIEYGLPTTSRVSLRVYDITGRLIRTLVSREEIAGYKSVNWDMRDNSGNLVTGGVYFYRLSAGRFTSTRKMIVLK